MATKSFQKNVTIRNKKDCIALVNALEHANKKGSTPFEFSRTIKFATREDVAKLFSK